MTGPRVDAQPHIPSLAEWEQSQYLTGPAAKRVVSDPTAGTAKVSALSRIPTLDEFNQMQGMTGPAIKALTVPQLPVLNAAGRDNATAPKSSLAKPEGKPLAPFDVKDPTTYANPVLRQLVNPAMDNPFQTAAVIGGAPLAATAVAGAATLAGASTGLAQALGGAAVLSPMIHTIAQYGWQKAAELTLNPEDRKRAESDPDRVSGEAAAVQAAMLGLAPLIHVGVRAGSALDVSRGMMDAHGLEADAGQLGITRNPHATSDFAQSLEDGAATAQVPRATLRPPGFQEAPSPSVNPRRVKGLTPNNPFNEIPANRVRGTATEAPSAPLQDAADLSAAITPDPELLAKIEAMRPKRRAQAAQNFFETEAGAQVLGATAARHGLPETANAYHPDSPQAAAWSEGHQSAVASSAPAEGSFPEGFSMGGSLDDSRIPHWMEGVGKVEGLEGPQQGIPEGATPETVALSNALKPNPYRAHTPQGLAEAALDAQKAIETAQAAIEQAATRPLVGERAQADMENRGVSYADEAEGSTTAAEKQLAKARAQMNKIEREFALRGVRGDELADVMKAAQEQRAEREGMQQDEHLNAVMGKDDPFGEAPAAGSGDSLQPIAGTGETVTRGLSAGVDAKAVESGLSAITDGLPDYQRVSMADQAQKAADLLASDPAQARRIALGQEIAPKDVIPEAVFVAVENDAIARGDVDALRELASGKLTEQATTMGQRIRTLAERNPESPVGAIESVQQAREAAMPKNAGKKIAADVDSIKAELGKLQVTPDHWAAFIQSIRC